jgi:hypothetical protein
MIHLDQLVVHQLDQTRQQRDHLQFNDQELELHPLFVFKHLQGNQDCMNNLWLHQQQQLEVQAEVPEAPEVPEAEEVILKHILQLIVLLLLAR